MHIILQEDYDLLLLEINKVDLRVKELRSIVRDSLSQSSETYHDNFDYEDGNRQLLIHEAELFRLRKIASTFHVKEAGDKVLSDLGTRFEILFENEPVTTIVTIGGTYVPPASSNISYSSPLAQFLVGAKVGDVGFVKGEIKVVLVAKESASKP